MEVVLDHGLALPEADDVVVAGHEVEALVVHLAAVDGEPGHHVARVPLLHADVDRLPPPADVRVPRLHHVRRVDDDVGVDVGRVDPLAREVLGQEAAGHHRARAHRVQPHPLGRLLDGLEDVALRRDGGAQVVVVVAVLQEAAVLLVLPRLLRVGHREEVVLSHEPVAQTAVLDHCKKGSRK